MLTRISLTATALGCLSIWVISESVMSRAEAAERRVTNHKPYVTWSGPRSDVGKRSVELIKTKEHWEKTWLKHAGAPKQKSKVHGNDMPEIDFEHCMVVAVFQGSGWNSDGVSFESIEESADRLLIRFDDKSYQTSGPNGGGVRVTPFGIIVIRRIEKPVVLQEDVQSLIGGPPKWKERARFKPDA